MGDPKQTPTLIGFERMYSDGSGVEYGVTYDARRGYGNEIEIKRVNEIDWPADEIDWLISALTEIRRTILDTRDGDGGRDG